MASPEEGERSHPRQCCRARRRGLSGRLGHSSPRVDHAGCMPHTMQREREPARSPPQANWGIHPSLGRGGHVGTSGARSPRVSACAQGEKQPVCQRPLPQASPTLPNACVRVGLLELPGCCSVLPLGSLCFQTLPAQASLLHSRQCSSRLSWGLPAGAEPRVSLSSLWCSWALLGPAPVEGCMHSPSDAQALRLLCSPQRAPPLIPISPWGSSLPPLLFVPESSCCVQEGAPVQLASMVTEDTKSTYIIQHYRAGTWRTRILSQVLWI